MKTTASIVFWWLTLAIIPVFGADQPARLRLVTEDGITRAEVSSAGQVVLRSPSEGLWSIATAWENGWPADWHSAHPDSVESVGDWTIVKGEIPLPTGAWNLRDSYRQEGMLIRCVRRFEWHGREPLDRTTLSVRFQAPGTGTGVVIPGVLYHGNPSGARSGRTPVYTGSAGETSIYEEHRLPMPFASFEFESGPRRLMAALHTLPSPVAYGHLPDQWWSLGADPSAGFTELELLSGPCASNGSKSVVKASQSGFLPYENAYLKVAPGAIIEKTFFLQGSAVDREGSGFQHAVRAALDLFGPFSSADLPSFSEIIEAKLRYADTRWYEQGNVAGFRKYFDKNTLVLGWCGQSAALGYALQLLDPNPKWIARVQKSLDFLSTSPFYEEGFHTWYQPDAGKWEQPGGRPEILSQGQSMQNFANAIRLGRNRGRDTRRWEEFLRRAADFHSARILDSQWSPVSTNEAFFIAPLTQASVLFQDDHYRKAAIRAAEFYASRHLTMREPYWGGTLDASCEDKEGAWAALEGFLAAYKLTGEKRYLDWAEHAADVALTYLVVWDIDLPAGRLRDHNFKTRGWTAVSVQNQHIDVYGVLIAPSLYRLGELTGRPELKKIAELMFRSCGQLIDPSGSQGEQPQHTNYAQQGEVTSAFGHRGGYVESWTVFWITAHFLNAAAQFQELGLAIP